MELSVKKVPREGNRIGEKRSKKKRGNSLSLSALSQKRADSCDEGNDGALSLECYSAAVVVVVAAVRRKRRRKRKRSVKVYFFKKKVHLYFGEKKVVVFGEEKQLCSCVVRGFFRDIRFFSIFSSSSR